MSSLMIAAVVAGSFLGSLTMDMGLNVFQDYYHVFYQDAFWNAAKNVTLPMDKEDGAGAVDEGFGISMVDQDESTTAVVR